MVAAVAQPSLQADGTVSLHGREYYRLQDVAGFLGMKFDWIAKGKSARLHSKWTEILLEEHKRDIYINGTKVHLGDPITEYYGNLHISEIDYQRTIQPILTPQVFGKPSRLYRIVIDPGHGGKDPGAENNRLRLQEKQLALDLALRLRRLLEPYGYSVHLTRENDRFLELDERARIANRLQADLFVSLHFNSSERTEVEGIETFVLTPRNQPSSGRSKLYASDRAYNPANDHDVWNTLVGYYVQRELVKELGAPDRGLKRARFAVLREARVPALLVEGGFVSHGEEGRKIAEPEYRERIARGIVRGILTYQKTLNRLRD